MLNVTVSIYFINGPEVYYFTVFSSPLLIIIRNLTFTKMSKTNSYSFHLARKILGSNFILKQFCKYGNQDSVW